MFQQRSHSECVVSTNKHGDFSRACALHRYKGSLCFFSTLSPTCLLSWCRCPTLACCSLCPCRFLVDRDRQSLSNTDLTWSKTVAPFSVPSVILSTRPAPALLAKLLPTQLWLPVDEHDMVFIESKQKLQTILFHCGIFFQYMLAKTMRIIYIHFFVKKSGFVVVFFLICALKKKKFFCKSSDCNEPPHRCRRCCPWPCTCCGWVRDCCPHPASCGWKTSVK